MCTLLTIIGFSRSSSIYPTATTVTTDNYVTNVINATNPFGTTGKLINEGLLMTHMYITKIVLCGAKF